jgi:hypothetical protein
MRGRGTQRSRPWGAPVGGRDSLPRWVWPPSAVLYSLLSCESIEFPTDSPVSCDRPAAARTGTERSLGRLEAW